MATPSDFTGTKSTDDIDADDSPSAENAETDGADQQGEDQEAKITLSKEQLEAAGLRDLEEGDAFTVTLHGTVTDKGDAEGITADIDSLEDGTIDGLQAAGAPPLPIKAGPTIKGPQAAGMFTQGSPMLPSDEQ
jgi:hypothetical protein